MCHDDRRWRWPSIHRRHFHHVAATANMLCSTHEPSGSASMDIIVIVHIVITSNCKLLFNDDNEDNYSNDDDDSTIHEHSTDMVEQMRH